MRNLLPLAFVLATTILVATPSYGWELCNLLGLRCGLCGFDAGCEPGCGCDPCGSEIGCGCEPACGCASCCGAQFAGQTWDGCGPSSVPVCECTGSAGCCEASCGCGGACGCDPCGCGGEVGCGCEPACGCGTAGCGNRGCLDGVFFGSCCGCVVGFFDRLCGGGCNGCSNEVYWSEWHNDPPRCCDPCDQCGNWTGPSYAGYRAPYDQQYHVGSAVSGPHVAGGLYSGSAAVASRPRTIRTESGARPTFATSSNRTHPMTGPYRPTMRGQVTRKPASGPSATYQR
jgi:hypothetical protein